jgi:hypothetical protein
LEYRNDLAAVTASIDYGKANGSTLKSTAVVGTQGFALGLSGEYFFGNQEARLTKLDSTLAYSYPTFDVALFGYYNK